MGVGTGAEDAHAVAFAEVEGEMVGVALIEDVGAVAGGTGEDDGGGGSGASADVDGVTDGFVHGFRETAELAAIEIDPTNGVLLGLTGDEDDFGFNDAGFGDEVAAGFDHDVRERGTEVAAEGLGDGVAVSLGGGDGGGVLGRKATTEVEGGEMDAGGAEAAEEEGGEGDGVLPGVRIGLLGADVEGEAVGDEAEGGGGAEELEGHFRVAAELAGERPFGSAAGSEETGGNACAGGVAGDFFEFGGAIDGEHVDAGGVGFGDGGGFLDGVAEGEAGSGDAELEALTDFGGTGDIETGPGGGEGVDDFGHGVGLHGVVDMGEGEGAGEFTVFPFDHGKVDGEEGRRQVSRRARLREDLR